MSAVTSLSGMTLAASLLPLQLAVMVMFDTCLNVNQMRMNIDLRMVL